MKTPPPPTRSSRNVSVAQRLIAIVLLLSYFTSASGDTSQLPGQGDCTADEYAGIGNCVSAGSGFTFDQEKAVRCPQRGSDPDPHDWDDDKWKCHIYCSNPERSVERQSCTNCPEVSVSSACFDAQTTACEAAKQPSDTVICDSASLPSNFLGVLLLFAGISLLLL